jgi:DNA mismatch repair protein MutL
VAIQVLPSQLIDQIAAGEVVERPASVVKELVENSLDAGARSIEVAVEAGGSRLIRVTDDGTGILAAELPLALSRHATSKIATLDDLEGLTSMGFRGEALPSIGSVSRLTITSRPAGSEHAWRIACDGGDLSAVRPAAQPYGTTVEVRDLFFNTPARRKFLRAEKTEAGHVDAVLKNLALARFDVEFRFKSNERTVWHLPIAADRAAREARLAELCGAEFLEHARYFEREIEGMRIAGWLAAPAFSRSQTDMQFTFVNRRFVRDKLLRHAVRLGYQDVLFQARQPAFVVFLELDLRRGGERHPAKLEVRCDSRLVHDFVFRTIEMALASTLEAGRRGTGPGARQRVGRARSRALCTRAAGVCVARGDVRDYTSLYERLHAHPEPRAGCATTRFRAAARLRLGAAARRVRAGGRTAKASYRRHACGPRADHVREAQDRVGCGETERTEPASAHDCFPHEADLVEESLPAIRARFRARTARATADRRAGAAAVARGQ